jgi:hypothetical protein
MFIFATLPPCTCSLLKFVTILCLPLTADFKTLKGRVGILTADNKALTADNETLRRRVNILTADYKTLKRRMDTLTALCDLSLRDLKSSHVCLAVCYVILCCLCCSLIVDYTTLSEQMNFIIGDKMLNGKRILVRQILFSYQMQAFASFVDDSQGHCRKSCKN